MRSPRIFLVAGLVAAVALAACGGTATPTGPAAATGATTPTGAAATSGPAAPTGGTAATTDPGTGSAIDTCKLVTVADLKTATSADYGAGVDDGFGQCVYRVGGATANNGDGQLVIAVLQSDLNAIKTAFGAGGVDTTIAGKAAFWNPSEGLQTLWVDLGGKLLVLSFDPVDDTTKAAAEKIAEAAVSGL